ncbi:hypothetical protein AVEN_37559-1 [Araneus ventricosus]|uniref:CCHC-type domain-containing protein n=1 Tax=Araneus ventricosus TaxID=182803 RepID=A0A4Y2X0G0_ARAVE|nr:hypothetical protein AVEN_37559-1 [Araneus ventricosus]
MGKKSKKSVLLTEQTDTLKENLPSTRTEDVISKTVRFLVLSVPNNNLSKKSPFAIQKGLDGISKNLKSVKKLASGDLLLETGSALQSKAFLSAKTFLDLPVTITPHKTLNFCRGVVSDDELLFSSDEEILEGLSSQGVVNVRRILTRKGTATIPTKHVILTFSSTVLPSSIKAGYLNIRVRPYIPYPLRCFKCQKFGHSQTACRGKQICSRCAFEGHSYSSCQSKPNCANCHQAHESASKSCPKWIEEKKIQEVRVKKKLTYSEARKLFQSESATSYAQITKVSKPAMSTQTDESLTQLPCPPLQSIKVSPLNETPTGLPKQFSVSKTVQSSDTLSTTPDHPVAPSVLLRSYEVPVYSTRDGTFQHANSTEPKRKQPFTGTSVGDENVEILPMKKTKVVLQSLESDADAEMSASTSDESDILEYNASESLDDPPENPQASGTYSDKSFKKKEKLSGMKSGYPLNMPTTSKHS